MIKTFIAVGALLLSSGSLMAGEEVDLTGTYQVQVGCFGSYHDEISFVVVSGKNKFSGIKYALSLTGEQKKKLRSGTSIIRIRGEKQPATTKTMTKGAVRKAVYHHMKTSDGMPLHSQDIEAVVRKIAVQPAGQVGKHNHGPLALKAVDDDHEEVEVTIIPHIAVESIDVISQGGK